MLQKHTGLNQGEIWVEYVNLGGTWVCRKCTNSNVRLVHVIDCSGYLQSKIIITSGLFMVELII